MTRKRTSVGKPRSRSAPAMCREYQLDYRKAKPNRFADATKSDAVSVVLDPDVAAVFDSSESVNTLLRSLIAAMPHSDKR